MTNRNRSGVLVIALVTCMIATVSACGTDEAKAGPSTPAAVLGGDHTASAAATDPHPHHAGGHQNAEILSGEHTDHSIYHLDSEWWDQNGQIRELGTLAGKVQVVSMVYTHCSHTCPRIMMEMKQLEGRLGEAYAGRVGFVLVSIDPERDHADRLAAFAASTHLDPADWTLLGGSDGDVLELATLLGIKYRRESEQDFSHSNSMLVLNPAGEIVFRQEGLGQDHGPMLDAIRTAAQ